MKRKRLGIGGWFGVLLGTLVVLGVDAVFGYMLYQNISALGRPTVEGKIIDSWVSRHPSRKGGPTYKARISFTYRVGDREYTGRALRMGFDFSTTESQARAEVARYPIGSMARVYYDPALPDVGAMLEPGFYPVDLVVFMLMTPFTVLMFKGWVSAVRSLRGFSVEQYFARRIRQEGSRSIARLCSSTLGAFATCAGTFSVLLAVVSMLTPSMHSSFAVMGGGLCAVIIIGVLVALRHRHNEPRFQVVIDPVHRALTYAVDGGKSAPATVSFDQVGFVDVRSVDHTVGRRLETRYRLAIDITSKSGKKQTTKTVTVWDFDDEDEAKEMKRWMSKEMRRGA